MADDQAMVQPVVGSINGATSTQDGSGPAIVQVVKEITKVSSMHSIKGPILGKAVLKESRTRALLFLPTPTSKRRKLNPLVSDLVSLNLIKIVISS
ncbi:hypothetical protein QJS04_geneDACA020461 [Acorus gramineus]|uniref:Uncharacterized protein n=1 Tax=Acorus gramineus TaxID=55184 RepID=A0AAV9ADA5_ACOGR|nr:hypothetical protein QJS04_geneDACA020461 [Acorus gramineus]